MTKDRRTLLFVVPIAIAAVLFASFTYLRFGYLPNQSSQQETYGSGGGIDFDQAPGVPEEPAEDQVDGSHEEMKAELPTGEMSQTERLTRWTELNPPGSSSKNEPQADWDNWSWAKWNNHYLGVIVNKEAQASEGEPNQGEYWMAFAAVKDPNGSLMAIPFEGSTQTERSAYIWDSTSDHYEASWEGDLRYRPDDDHQSRT